MSGEVDSSVKGRLAAFQKQIEDYLTEAGVVYPNTDKEECEVLLSVTVPQMDSWDASYCLLNANRLFQYAMVLQKEMNRHKAIYDWSNDLVQKGVAEEIKSLEQSYLKYESKFQQCVMGNNFLQAADKCRRHAQIRMDLLTDLAKDVRSQAGCMDKLSYIKRG